MRPLVLVLVLMVETFALASLVAIEVQERTVVAVLATPARVNDFLAAKGIFGTALAFIEVTLLGLLIGAFAVNAPVIIVTLLLGAVLVTGFGLFSGAFGRDFLGTLFIAFFFMIPLMIPAMGALFPGRHRDVDQGASHLWAGRGARGGDGGWRELGRGGSGVAAARGPGAPEPLWSAPMHFDEGWRRYEPPAVVAGLPQGAAVVTPLSGRVFAIAMPLILTFLISAVFGSLFDANPKLGIVDQGGSEVTVAAQQLDGVEVVLVEHREAP